MPCIIIIALLGLPRLAIVLTVLFSDYIGQAYQTTMWPLLGFFFAPFTTLAYAGAINEHGSVDGLWLIVVIIAVLADLGVFGGAGASGKSLRE